MAVLIEAAPAKVNLTLRVGPLRADGYHPLESLAVFTRFLRDIVILEPGGPLALDVRGAAAAASGPAAENLILRAARALIARAPGVAAGRFTLIKRLPVAAGLGGGSADAAAALRLIARANGMATDDPRVAEAAAAAGADIPVCIGSCARVMRGKGEILSAPLPLPALWMLLVNPGVAVPTASVFKAFDRGPPPGPTAEEGGLAHFVKAAGGLPAAAFAARLADHGNDLEPAAIAIAPVIADVLAALRALPDCLLARMSGSGATCFGLFASARAAGAACARLRATRPQWRACATTLR